MCDYFSPKKNLCLDGILYIKKGGTFHTCGPGNPPSGHPSGQFTSFCNKVYSCSIPYLLADPWKSKFNYVAITITCIEHHIKKWFLERVSRNCKHMEGKC